MQRPTPPYKNAQRAIRIANCSGANMDPGIHMYNQAKYGPVDVITGDYLAEGTMAKDAEAMAQSKRPGWVRNAMDGIAQSLEIINEKRIKIVVNGGGLNPKGMAEAIHKLVKEKNLRLRVAFVHGDNLMHKVHGLLRNTSSAKPQHLDGNNADVNLARETLSFLDDPEGMPIIVANAYLGYRSIRKGLEQGADIIVCGRVADASPVIGAAAWWYGWAESDFDQLAGALIAGHLIECSTYVTGGNFSGAYKHAVDDFIGLAPPIAEIAASGECVVTKHDALNGFVTTDTVKCQLLYELQGNIYLNSDVKADITRVKITKQAKNRVLVTGVRGFPPPPTTKLAVFYRAGYQSEILVNASGYATGHKWDIQEAQLRRQLQEWGLTDKIDVLEFQRVGTAMENPDSQMASTTYMRIFTQAKERDVVRTVVGAWNHNFMAHFPGMHCSLDFRTVLPTPFLGYYPAVISQTEIEEAVHVLSEHDATRSDRTVVGPPALTEALAKRENYETHNPESVDSYGPFTTAPLGDIALSRSGDKGANVNLGLFVQTAEQWNWFRSFMTRDKLQVLMGKDWREEYFIERVEFPEIYAVHYVVYGPLGRGVSSSRLLDSLGKGFGEFIRAVHVPIPTRFLDSKSQL